MNLEYYTNIKFQTNIVPKLLFAYQIFQKIHQITKPKLGQAIDEHSYFIECFSELCTIFAKFYWYGLFRRTIRTKFKLFDTYLFWVNKHLFKII